MENGKLLLKRTGDIFIFKYELVEVLCTVWRIKACTEAVTKAEIVTQLKKSGSSIK